MQKTNESDQSIELLKRFLSRAISIKYFYLLCFLIFIPSAVLYNKYSQKVYKVGASIIPAKNDASSLLSSNELFRSIGTLQNDKNIETEMNNLKSFALVNATINKMNFEISYFKSKKGLFKETNELFNDSPFSVNIDKSHIQPIEVRFNVVVINETTYRLSASQNLVSYYNYVDNKIVSTKYNFSFDTICKFNETISNNFLKFSLTLNRENLPPIKDPSTTYFFTLDHLDYLSAAYLGRLDIKRVSPLASIISIQFRGANPEKTISFLNSFLDTYLADNLAKKNKIAKSTINFIDSQISEMSDSLVQSESKLRNYRSTNQVMDLSFQGQRLYDQMSQIETERANLRVQERYYNYILNNFKTNKDISGVVPPSAMNVADPIMNQLITELLNLNSQRSGIVGNNSDKNIFVGQIDAKIKVQKQAIIENVTNNLNTLSLSLNELNYRSDKLSKEISQLPKTELNMVGIQRKFNLNSTIYTYLLQKRSEAAISYASNYPDYEILEPARSIQSVMVAPKRKLDLFFAVFMALLIPTSFIVVKDLFNNRIVSYTEVEHIINRPIIGVIYSNDSKSESVVTEFPGTPISESFRNLRGSLFLKLKSQQSKVILVTSTLPGDGKSFIAYNLAASIASVGNKTVIIDCDLRRPSLHKKFKSENSTGLTNYMTNNASFDQICNKTSIENLCFISAGPVIANPSEQIESGVLDDLISKLKKDFEYIIIDTTPIGIVADASLLIKYASELLMVTRNNFTIKDIFSGVVDNLNSKQIANYDVVFNDLSFNKSPYKNYSNYYLKKK
jgi:tyrosine-protein kinase Etk/Wzc